MDVNIIKLRSIDNYVLKHPVTSNSFHTWLLIIKSVDWKTINDVKKTFPSADPIENKRIIFNIGGNKCRMICGYHFGQKKVTLFIKWIGTHAECTKICNENKQYTINNY